MSYHDRPEISVSMLHMLNESPEDFKREYIDGLRRVTDCLDFGQLFHCAILEPLELDSRFAVAPKCDRRTKVGKETYADFEAQNRGKTIVDEQDMRIVNSMVKAMRGHEVICGLLNRQYLVEHEIYFDLFNTACRSKLDYIDPKAGLIVDFKSVRESDPWHMQKFALQYGLHRQQAMYQHAAKTKFGRDFDFLFCVVNKCEPFQPAVFKLDSESVELGMNSIRELMVELKSRKESNDWRSDFTIGIQSLRLPEYVFDVDSSLVFGGE